MQSKETIKNRNIRNYSSVLAQKNGKWGSNESAQITQFELIESKDRLIEPDYILSH